ncbi:MAG: hypothetical protein DCC55_12925 [Chloroflexi bacterium]|nr:MAG: hypothetical protein DCC55_12925 [Chloroflexota bacterium]
MAAVKSTTKRVGHVLIIWGDNFDEAAAAVFATELRQAGLPVKVVGLVGRQAIGLYGLLLGADLTLGDALLVAHQAIGVILPCTAATVQRIDNDPRVYELLQQACANGAPLIIQHADALRESRLKHLPVLQENINIYGEQADLIAFARTLAISWQNRAG